jgi:transposase
MDKRRARRKFTPEFKVKVVIESLKERDTLAVLAKRFELHPNQITAWRREFLDRSPDLFKEVGARSDASVADAERLYAQIGRLKVENDFLKKSLNRLEP